MTYPNDCGHCGHPEDKHPVACFGCQTCQFTCDHYICVTYVARPQAPAPPAPDKKEPCGNEECDLCNPLPRYKVSTERVQRLFHERTIKAATPEDALRIYNEGTAWPSSYDDRSGEILEKHPTVVALEEPLEEPLRSQINESRCYHNLPSVTEFMNRGHDP